MASSEGSNLHILYVNLKEQNFDVPDTYDSFERTLCAPGKEGTENRVTLYKNLKEQNFDVPDTYDSFARTLFAPVKPKAAQNQQSAPKVAAAAPAKAVAKPTPQPTAQQKPQQPTGQGSPSSTPAGGAAPLRGGEQASKPAGMQQAKGAVKPWGVTGASQGASVFDPFGKRRGPEAEPKEMSLQGALSSARGGRPVRGGNKAQLEREKVNKEMALAQASYDELNRLANKRYKEIEAEVMKAEADMGVAGKILNVLSGGVATSSPAQQVSMRQKQLDARLNSDATYRQYMAAIDERKEQMRTLGNKRYEQQGGDVGFWRGFGQTVADINTWTSVGGLNNAMAKLGVSRNPNSESAKALLAATNENEQTQQEHGDFGFWNSAGVVGGYMPKFMLDFATTGGGFDLVKVGTRLGAKAAVKAIGKEAAEKIAKDGVKAYVKANGLKGASKVAGGWALKALGTTADDLLIRAPLMTNTVGLAGTIADAVDRKLGETRVDDKGNISFENKKGWGDAVWQAEANAIIENYSEMFGTHLDGGVSMVGDAVKGALKKVSDKFGAGALTKVLAKTDRIGLTKVSDVTRRAFEKMGVSDYFGEVGEEYYGQVWRTALNLDDAYTPKRDKDGNPVYKVDEAGNIVFDEYGEPVQERENLLLNGRFNTDILGGMALTMGLMGAVKSVASAAGYARHRKGVARADKAAANLLGQEQWDGLRDVIDATENEQMGELAISVAGDASLTADQRGAVLDYMERAMVFRGYNLGDIAKKRDEKSVAAQAEADMAFEEGYMLCDGMDPMDAAQKAQRLADTHAVNLRVDEARGMCADAFGDDAEYWMGLMDEDPWDLAVHPSLSQAQRDAVLYYINSKAAQEGVQAAAADAAEARRAEVKNSVDRRTHQERGTIQPAVMKVDDRQVYVVKGDVVMFPDGTDVDRNNSSESVIVCDAETGEFKFASPGDILRVDEEIDPQTELDAAFAEIDAEHEAVTQTGESVPNNTENAENITNPGPNITENEVSDSERVQNTDVSVENVQQESALSRIPVDEKSGEPMFEQAPDHETAWDGLVEAAGDNAEVAAEIAQAQADAVSTELAKLMSKPPKVSGSPMQMLAQKKEHQDKIDALRGRLDTWNGILGVNAARAEREAAAQRQAEAQRELQRLEDERRAEREAERQRQREEGAQSLPQYRKAINGMDEPVTLREYILRSLLGGTKLRWNKSENGSHGIAGHLFGNRQNHVKNVSGEYGKYKWMVDEAAGATPEQMAEAVCQDFYNDYERDTDHYDEVLNEVLDVLSLGSPRAMWEELNAERERLSNEQDAYSQEYDEADQAWLDRYGMGEEEWLSFEDTHGELMDMTDAEYDAFMRELADARADDERVIAADRELYNEIANEYAGQQDQLDRLAIDRAAEEEAAGSYGGALGRGQEVYNDGRGAAPGQEGPAAVRGDVREASAGSAKAEQSGIAGDARGMGERSGDILSQETVTCELSNEVNEFGKPFVKSSNGTIDFGFIDEESGLQPLPIRLSLGENYKDEKNEDHGYGYIHISAGHRDEIIQNGFSSVEEFVESVARDYTDIRIGAKIANNQTYLLEVTDEHNNTLFIQLSRDGMYWNVNSAGIFKKKYSRRKPKVYSKPAVGDGTATDAIEVNSGQNEGATAPAGNSSKTSERKVNTSASDKQGIVAESSNDYTIDRYTKKGKKGKANRELVRVVFPRVEKSVWQERLNLAKDMGGEMVPSGYGFKTEAEARAFAEAVMNPEAVADAQPLTKEEIREAVAPKTEAKSPKKPANRASIEEVMEEPAEVPNKGVTGGNHLVSEERYAELRARLSQKFGGQLNMGIDPEILAIGTEMAVYHIERGAHKFKAYASAMIADLGDVIRPYLKSFYNAVRDLPEAEAAGLMAEMDSYDDVRAVDTANFDKGTINAFATAENVVAQQAAEQQAAAAKDKIKKERNQKRKERDEQTTADTVAIATEAGAAAGEASRAAETSNDAKELERADEKIDEALDKVDAQLGMLAYYEGEHGQVEKQMTESAVRLARSLAADLGIEFADEQKKANAVTVSVAPGYGGTAKIVLPLGAYDPIVILFDFDRSGNGHKLYSITYKHVESTHPMNYIVGESNTIRLYNQTYSELLEEVKRIWSKELKNTASIPEPMTTRERVKEWLDENEARWRSPWSGDYASKELGIPKDEARAIVKSLKEERQARRDAEMQALADMAERGDSPYTVTPEVEAELAKQRAEKSINGYKIGDEVMYQRNGKGKWEKYKISDFDSNGRPILDSFGVSFISEVADWKHIKPANGVFGEAERVANKAAEEREKKSAVAKASAPKYAVGDYVAVNGQECEVINVHNDGRLDLKAPSLGGIPRTMLGITPDKVYVPGSEDAIKHWYGVYADRLLAQGGMKLNTLEVEGLLEGAVKKVDREKARIEGGDRSFEAVEKLAQAIAAELVLRDRLSGRELKYRSAELPVEETESVGKTSTKADLASIVETLRSGKPVKKPNNPVKAEDTIDGVFNVINNKSETSQINNNDDEKKTDVRTGSGAAEREKGHEPRQNEPMGTRERDQAARPVRGGVAGRDGEHSVPDTGRGSRVSEQHQGGAGVGNAPKNTRNNRAERGVDYAPKSEKARIDANIAAIELAKKLLASGATATAEEMAVLRRYSGWGGLGSAFNEGSTWAPNPINKRLREVLTPEEYEAAVMSRNSAYFTPAEVIDNLWDIAKALGFDGGNMLEGSAGIGNIIGLMPAELSGRSNIHAVEIDPMTGGILSLLYPDAKVEVQGFEKTKIGNGSVDLAITNVPFVTGLHVMDESGDSDLSKKFRDIHDFCIAKNVRKLCEGGIGIFITSSGTLDKSHKLREWLVNDKGGGSDVVGVFRMNNKTFGGTAATSDIIVVRKRVNGRKSANAIDVSTVSAARTASHVDDKNKTKELPLLMNRYFIEHPECMGGEMFFGFEHGDTYRPTSTGLYQGKVDQSERMSEWVQSLAAKDWTDEKASTVEDAAVRINEVLGEGVKEGSMVIDSEGNLCVACAGHAVPLGINKNKIKGRTKLECFKDYSAIKSAVADVLAYQTEHVDDAGLQPLLDRLNSAYDTFVERYGNLNKNNGIAWLRHDVDFASVVALETYSEKGTKDGKKVQTYGKTDIFSRRVVDKESEPSPKNVKDGIIASLYIHGRIDMEYLAEQLGKSQGELKQEIVEGGLGFENPTNGQMEVSYEYLSGNVREKLRQAREANEASGGLYDANVKALEGVVPMNIPAHLIEFTLGSSWIEPQLYERYIKERTELDVKLTNAGGTWYMDEPYFTNKPKNDEMGVRSEKLDIFIQGHELIEAALTNKTITVKKTIKDRWGTRTETDQSATIACATKVDEIRQDFKDWAREQMQADPDMAMRIEEKYNEQFNNSVPKVIPDEFVPEHFGGAATTVGDKPFKLRPHQGKAVVRATTQPVLLAHEVGTGKTYTLITTAMEMRRLGTARKPMIVVQNATVGQFVASAKELYPNAKVLTLNDEDRTKEGRKAFYAKIKYNDWDMIVVPQSVLEMIPDSVERQTRFIQDKIEEKLLVLEQMKEADPSGRNPIVRAAKREIEKLQDEIAQLANGENAAQGRGDNPSTEKDAKKEAVVRQNAEVKAKEMLDRVTDDVEDFDSMGIDALLVDEAHEYKHLGFATAMQRGVKGIDPSYSKKSQGVYLKAQAVLEKTGGKNVVFATGTPISNTAAEIWTFMRYLMPADEMKEYGVYYFDDFVRNFGNLQQMLEFKTNGKYEEVNRFAGYINTPELVRIWSTVADTVLTREAGGVSDKIPEMEGGMAQDIFLPQTRALRSIMKYVKEQLAAYEEMSGKQKKENSHIPLVMYDIAKAAAVDARLVQVDAEDDPNSKTNEAVRQTLRSLEETKDYNGTVAIFADNYQNKKSGFNLYEDIRKKLVAAGVPEEQVVVMKSNMTVKKKLEIFDKVNRGEVRVVMGSTFTLGTGVNIQERLHTLIHVDAPNRPMDYTQRNGRILRQGNLHKDWGMPVRVLRFGVEDSLDVTAYQRLKTKGAIADSIMNGKTLMENSMENRSLEEDQDLFGDITAQLSGSEYAMLKNQVEKEVRKLTAKLKQWEADQAYIHNRKRQIAGQNKDAEQRMADAKGQLAKIESAPSSGISVGSLSFPGIEAMEDFFTEQNKKKAELQEQVRTSGYYSQTVKSDVTVNVGGFHFNIHTEISRETKHGEQGALFYSAPAKMTYSCEELGIDSTPVSGNLIKNAVLDIVENVMTGKDLRERIEAYERKVENNNAELESFAARDGVPFKFADELANAQAKLEEYEELMKAEMEAKEARYAEIDSTVETATDVELTEENEEGTEDAAKYREEAELEAVNERFDDALNLYDEGRLPVGYRFELGMPSDELRSAGFPNLPIVMRSSLLARKAGDEKHPFAASDLKGLVNALQQPIAVFRYTKENIRNIIVDLTRGGKHFLVGVTLDYKAGEVEVNSVSGLFPKENHEWVKWIQDGKAVRIGQKEKVLNLIDSLRTNPAESERIGLNLDSVAKIVENFDNPTIEAEENEDGVSQRVLSLKTSEHLTSAIDESQRVLAKEYDTDRGAMEARVREVADKLGAPVRIITDEAEVAKFSLRRRRRAKGWFDPVSGEIVVVLPNNSSVADAERTVAHEVVAHYGLRKLIGEEKFNAFLDEVFGHASDKIKSAIEHRAQMEYERWVDAETRKRGGGAVAAAYATVEAEARKDSFRRSATEEYMADMAEKIAYDGFEKMDREEQTLWGRVKAKVMKFIEAILKGLKIGKSVKLTDKDIAYILYRSWKNLRDSGGSNNGGGIRPTALDIAEDAVMREKTGYNKTDGSKATTGESARNSKTGLNPLASSNSEHLAKVTEKIELAKVSERFDSDIERYERGELPAGYRFELGMPSAELRSAGFPNLPISMRESLLTLKSGLGRHPFAASDLLGLVNAIQKPIAVFEYTNDNVRNLIVDLKSGDKHFLVGVTLNFKRDGLEINSVSGLFPKDNHEWIKWIQDRRVIRIDQKEKVLSLIDSLRMNPAEADRIGLNLDSVAKIVENFENPTIKGEENDGDVMYRDGDEVMTKDLVLARALYEQRVATSSYQVREAMQDSMLGLLELYKSIEAASGRKRRIEDIASPENAYTSENVMSSRSDAEQKAYRKLMTEPMMAEVAKLCPEEGDYERLVEYMMAKHGLERNTLMRDRAVKAALDKGDNAGANAAAERDYAGVTGLARERLVREAVSAGTPESVARAQWADVDVATAEAKAADIVTVYEDWHDVSELWNKINAATKASLMKLKEGGVISQDAFDKVSGMYEYYIPLRGWAETTSDEVYGYITRTDPMLRGSVMKNADGRSSIADDPFASIALMGDRAIMEANRNKMKQAFFNYVRRNPSDLVSVNRLWLKLDDTSGEWEPALPDGPRKILEGDDAATVARKWVEHEQHMQALAQAEPNKYKCGRQASNIPYKVTQTKNLDEHTVRVKLGDEEFILVINGSPRAAQALNGLSNPDSGDGWQGRLFTGMKRGTNFMAPAFTTRNPYFMWRNFQKDINYANTQVWVKEDAKYAAAFNANSAKLLKMMPGLISRFENGKLDMTKKYDRLFHDFMMNGGETGYTQQRDMEKHRRELDRMLRDAKGEFRPRRIMEAIFKRWDMMNSSSENLSRFSAFVTSRESGRDMVRSVYDAKEITVNFNKKGAGATYMDAVGQTKVGKAAAFAAGMGIGTQIFWNARVQGVTNKWRNIRRNPAKGLGVMTAMFALGLAVALWHADDDDDDEASSYYNQPDYVRRTHLMWRFGDKNWGVVPLPAEYSDAHGMGVLVGRILSGREQLSASDIALEAATIMGDNLPMEIDFADLNSLAGIGHTLAPTVIKPAIEVARNKSWSGSPIYRENEFAKDMPNWTKAYSGTSEWLVWLSRQLNSATNGGKDAYSKGWIDFNPAEVEYLANAYLGGYIKLPAGIAKSAVNLYDSVAGDDEFNLGVLPVVGTSVRVPDERLAGKHTNKAYYAYMDEYDALNGEITRAKSEKDNLFDNADRLAAIARSAEFDRYWLIKGYKKSLDAIDKRIKQSGGADVKSLEAERLALRREVVGKLMGKTSPEAFDMLGIEEARRELTNNIGVKKGGTVRDSLMSAADRERMRKYERVHVAIKGIEERFADDADGLDRAMNELWKTVDQDEYERMDEYVKDMRKLVREYNAAKDDKTREEVKKQMQELR